MAAPTFHAAGAGASAVQATTTVSPAYPTVTANDLMLLHVLTRTNPPDTPTTPTGWTLEHADLYTGEMKSWVYSKTASGSETGTLTVTVPGGNSYKETRIYSFTGTNGAFEGASMTQSASTALAATAVTTGGADRLCVAFVSTREINTLGSFTGETGGDWTEAVAKFGTVGTIEMQTATLTTAGTISGGSVTKAAADPAIVRAFALKPGTVGGTASSATMLLLGAG